MKILHIQYSMTPAGNAAYRLHKAMLSKGIDSNVLLLGGTFSKEGVNKFSVSRIYDIYRRIIYRISNYILLGQKKQGTYFFSSLPFKSLGIMKNKLVQQADVIYLHWVAGGCLSAKDFESLSASGKIIVFFMHDMWNITGGCHHSLDCNQYMTGCNDCPMFHSKKLFVRSNIEKKIKYSNADNIFFVSPSNWLGKCARQSIVSKQHKIYVIPNVIDQKIFRPIDKKEARNYFGLPLDKKIISFGCQSNSNPFKGWKYLKEALNILDVENIHVVIYGGNFDKKTKDEIKYPVSFIGRIDNEEELGLISNVADVFVNPSLCENYSSVLLEHILCRVPVVAFDYTGNPDLVKTGATGYLAKYKDSDDMAFGITKILKGELIPTFDFEYSIDYIINSHLRMLSEIMS